jgi:hypothetical protein
LPTSIPTRLHTMTQIALGTAQFGLPSYGVANTSGCITIAEADLPPRMAPSIKLGVGLPIDQPCAVAEA